MENLGLDRFFIVAYVQNGRGILIIHRLTAIKFERMDKKKLYYNLPNSAKIVGKRISKTRQGHSKIFKNLSEFPIEINLQGKENQSIGTINRPHSSLAQEIPHKNLRIESALSHYPADPNRKRLSLDSTNKKHQRDSLLSRNSISKKASKNHIIIDDTTKLKLAQDRRRYNNSCGSAIDDRGAREQKKKQLKPKRPSINNLHLGVRREGEKSQHRLKDEKSLIIRDKTDKSKSKSKNKKKRKQSALDKSKASTTAILPNKTDKDKKFLKKKQSLSTAVINLPPKEKKKKSTKRPAEKVEIIEESSQAEYPINKYEVQVTLKKGNRPSLRPKSKSRKGSTSKERHKKAYSLIEEIDYSSCINIPSNSSGLINSLSHSSHNSSKIKIIDNWEYRYIADQNPTSVNLDEIRYFQQHQNTKQQREAEFISKNFNNVRYYRKRKEIEMEISEDYPNFNELELKFLASVMFIQRKWREHRLYKQIFSSFANPNELPSFIEKSNSKQLNISNGPKSPQKYTNKHTTQVEPVQVQPIIDTTPFSVSNQKPLEEKPRQKSAELRKQTYPGTKERLNNDAYLEPREYYSIRQTEKPFFEREREINLEFLEEERRSNSSKQFSLKSHRYEFLQSDIFPNITYIILKKEQLKEQLHTKLYEISTLQHNGVLLYDEYLKLKNQYESEYEYKLKQLNKSKQDIKKGYLKFIDTYKDIKHEALRKVSSESGLMASMYKKVFHFDQHIATPSNSSESLKILSKKMLIRKEFYLTQKVEPFIYNTSLLPETHTQRMRSPREEPLDLSARCFRSRRAKQEEQSQRKKDMFIDIESLSNERMDNKRIKEGYVISPHFEQEHKNMTLSFSKSDQLLPITIQSPKADPQQHIPQNYQRKERLILEEIIASLTHQLYIQLVSIDERRENMTHFSPEEKVKYTHVQELEMIEESKSAEESKEEKSDQFEIVEEERLREIYKIEGLQQKNNDFSQRRHRNSKEHNISPATSEKYAFDSEDIILYARTFLAFLTNNNIVDEIIVKLNKNQGFTPLEYLKFLRDFEIPDDQYDPLISNQTFIDWEDFFTNKHYPPKLQESEEVFVIRQSITIFHRCIFESIIFLLEEFRPCGEKGIPFPWEKVIYFPREITKRQMDDIFGKCLSRIEDTLKLGCGIIEEKYIVYNEEDLQRIHEQNEDKIINMLERELGQSPHNWYEVEQHCLEIKLELECEIIEYLMLEALDQILESY